jgi:hypothetical protein
MQMRLHAGQMNRGPSGQEEEAEEIEGRRRAGERGKLYDENELICVMCVRVKML